MTSSQPLDLISPMQVMAREAGSLLMDYFRQHVKIEYKGDVDLVTVADRESEALILERIRKPKGRASKPAASTSGTSIRSMAQRTLHMAILCFAFLSRSSGADNGSRE